MMASTAARFAFIASGGPKMQIIGNFRLTPSFTRVVEFGRTVEVPSGEFQDGGLEVADQAMGRRPP